MYDYYHDQEADAIELDENELEGASGGAGEASGTCHFTWTGREEKRQSGVDFEERSRWVECASRASSCPTCSCHKQEQCVNRWHMLDNGVRLALHPVFSFNHRYKQRENNYDTYY